MKEKLFTFIFVGLIMVLLIIFCFKTIKMMEKNIENKYILKCAEVYLTDIKNYNDYLYLCHDDTCTIYFTNRINQSITGFNKCFEGFPK